MHIPRIFAAGLIGAAAFGLSAPAEGEYVRRKAGKAFGSGG